MPRYDLYRSVHKFIRRELFNFGEKLGKTDFRRVPEIIVTKHSFDEIAFSLQMHARKEETYFTPLFARKGIIVPGSVAQDHVKQQVELEKFQSVFEEATGIEVEEARIVVGRRICSLYDQFLSHNLLHFHQEETLLMPALWDVYSDKELRQVTIDSYQSLPEHILLDSAVFFPVLNYHEKLTYLQDLSKACSGETFAEIWRRALASEDCFTDDEKSDFTKELNFPIEGSSSGTGAKEDHKGKASGSSKQYFIGDGVEVYHSSAMAPLMDLRIASLGSIDKSGVKRLPPQIIKDYSKQKDLYKIAKLFLEEHFQQKTTLVPLLIPSTTENEVMHWVGIVVTRQDSEIVITYLDSENLPVVDVLKRVLISQFKHSLPEFQIVFNQLAMEQQKYNNCGPEVIENFIYYLTGVRATQEAAVYAHSLLLENSLLDPTEYALKISDNNKVIGFLSNQVSLPITKPIVSSSSLEAMSMQRMLFLHSETFDCVKQVSEVSAQQAVTVKGVSMLFTTIYGSTDSILGRLSDGVVIASNTFLDVIMMNNYIRHKVLNYVYYNKLLAINSIINKHYIQSSDITQSVIQKHPLEWTKQDFKQIKLVVHPDKGGNDGDFSTVNAFQEQVVDRDELYQNFFSKLLPTIQTSIHKLNVGFKMLDTAVDSGRLIYEPTFRNANKVALDSTYLYSMYSGANGLCAVVTGSEALYQTYLGEYTQAFQTIATTIAYMALPSLLAYTAIPHLGLAYGIGMAAYTGYSAITNSYSFYLERSSNIESTLKSLMDYRDLMQVLSQSQLQQVYDFATTYKGYEIEINNLALESERKVLKAKLNEKSEFSQKLYDYIYKPVLEEKYTLLNELLLGNIIEKEIEVLKAKHIKIADNNYQHCIEMRDITDDGISSNGKNGTNDRITEHYYCYNDGEEILDHIVISKDNSFEVIEVYS
jgi:hypothetical protein